MARMNVLKRGMIVDINLDPIQGSETGKTRPCVIVTNDIYNARVPVIQVVPITSWSSKKSRIKTNVELLPSSESGLSKKSGTFDESGVKLGQKSSCLLLF